MALEDAIEWWRTASLQEREEFLNALYEDGDSDPTDIDMIWEIRP